MRRILAATMAAAMALVGVSTAQAQQRLDRVDRLLLYYNYYTLQRNSQRVIRNQQDLQRDLTRFSDRFDQRREPVDPVERYVLGPAERDRRPQLPPIYGGGQRGRQYFQRMDYFNTRGAEPAVKDR